MDNGGATITDMVDKDKLTPDERAYAKKVGAILTAKKDEYGLSFQDLADGTELSRAHLVRILNGIIDVRMGDLTRVCRLLELDPIWVLQEASGK